MALILQQKQVLKSVARSAAGTPYRRVTELTDPVTLAQVRQVMDSFILEFPPGQIRSVAHQFDTVEEWVEVPDVPFEI